MRSPSNSVSLSNSVESGVASAVGDCVIGLGVEVEGAGVMLSDGGNVGGEVVGLLVSTAVGDSVGSLVGDTVATTGAAVGGLVATGASVGAMGLQVDNRSLKQAHSNNSPGSAS